MTAATAAISAPGLAKTQKDDLRSRGTFAGAPGLQLAGDVLSNIA
jgi:hypothetical protein